MSLVQVRRALLSVSDKGGLESLARALSALGVELVSTGGTAATLRGWGLSVTDVSTVTQFPVIMDGRVKTLHPMIHGGLLGRRDRDAAVMAAYGIAPIDLLVVNLYPFRATVESGRSVEDCVEMIDIGGPAMIRAAAKNHADVAVLTDPSQYPWFLETLAAGQGAIDLPVRRRLARSAFAHTAAYDAAVAAWMETVAVTDTPAPGGAGAADGGQEDAGPGPLPETLTMGGPRLALLRYGENPHQSGALYRDHTGPARPGVASARQLQGKALSYNNIADTDAAFELVAEFEEPAVVIVKHANPCGAAVGASLALAYGRALACDPVSAFGGVIAVNRALDGETARLIATLFAEVVIAPEVTAEAAAALATKTNLRLLTAGGCPDPQAEGRRVRSVAGGLLVQTRDHARTVAADLRTVTRREPTAEELADLLFAWRVAKHVASNAIVFARDGATVGIGAGQMSRVDSARIAAWKAADAGRAAGLGESPTVGSVVASDAFFPFADGLIAAADAGATAVIQPGGSVRDADVIAAADARGLAMVFTGRRHFRH